MPTKQTLLLRADADSEIGTGHFMRCLALARAWEEHGGHSQLLSRCAADGLLTRARQAGIGLSPLSKSYPDPSDLAATLSHLGRIAEEFPGNPWLALDGYSFDSAYQSRIRAEGVRLLVIDDCAHQERYEADVLLNQNLGANALPYRMRPETLLLAGPRYALLRPEFLRQAKPIRDFSKTATKLLVTLGGADPQNATATVIEGIKRTASAIRAEVIVVIGGANPHFEKIEKAASDSIRVIKNTNDMPELMAWADIGIGAAGTTAWEMSSMGLPMIILSLADNQQGVAEALAEKGAAIHTQATAEAIAAALDSLALDSERRRKMSAQAQSLVDGNGAKRVASLLRCLDAAVPDLKLNARLADPDDVFTVWRLSNDPMTRANSFEKEPIPLETHRVWFQNQLSNPDTFFMMLTIENTVIGQIRYTLERARRQADVHFSIHPAFRGKGLGARALRMTSMQACEALQARTIRGLVELSNKPSLRAFEKAGFRRMPDQPVKGQSCAAFELAQPKAEVCR